MFTEITAIWTIAGILLFWSLVVIVGGLVMMFKLQRTLIKVEFLMDEVRGFERKVRRKVERTEPMLDETMRNLRDIVARVRETIAGLSLIFSVVGRLFGGLGRRASKE